MEHLTRNTNNDRLIYIIKNTKKDNQNILDNSFKELIDKITNILTALLSSIISATIISILKEEGIFQYNVILTVAIFIIIVLIFWFVLSKWIVPSVYKLFYRTRINITPKSEKESISQFNTEVMQKVAEITEIIEVIKTTKEVRCKTLNFVISLYKFQEIVDFLANNFASDNKKELRKSKDQGSTELLRYSFNIYTVSAVLEATNYIGKQMGNLANYDNEINSIEGIELLRADLTSICRKLDKITIPY